MVANGKTNCEIADTLVLSERTVEYHVGNILSKLAFDSRSQIAVLGGPIRQIGFDLPAAMKG